MRRGRLETLALLAALAIVTGLSATSARGATSAERGSGPRIPARNTSGHPDCASEPSRRFQIELGFLGNSYPIVGSVDANGCDSWTYELASSFGPRTSFFAGPGFRAGQQAYQYGTQEITELLGDHQLIRVVDPTKEWLLVYRGYDFCTKSAKAGRTRTTCIAPAPERRPDDLVLWIPAGIGLGVLVLFMIHFLRPAGPIRRRRHYRRLHRELIDVVPTDPLRELEGLDIGQLQRRLRRLERAISPQLTESQHHWFTEALSSGRHGLALESVARWLAESHLPVLDHVRDEMLWIASSLKIEHEVRPILDAQVFAPNGGADLQDGVPMSKGFDVPLAEFKELVAEAVDSLPPAFGKAMTNVAIVIEEEDPHRRLLGLYEGHPLAAPRYRNWVLHADKITIYRRTICQNCADAAEVRAMVYRVVIHEIAHHFGIDEPRLRELGW